MQKYCSLSQNQLALYYKWQMNKDLLSYNTGKKIILPLSINLDRLKKAVILLAQKYPGLRTRFSIVGGVPVQWIDSEDINVTIEHTKESEIDLIIKNYICPIDLLSEPLCEFNIYVTEQHIYLLQKIHHSIVDGRSTTILFNSLAAIYAGENIVGEQHSINEYILEMQDLENTESYKNQINYFETRFKGLDMTSLPRQLNSPGGKISKLLARVKADWINMFGWENEVSPNNIIATALSISLSRVVRDDRVSFCTVHHGRVDEKYKQTVGMFIKTLPFTTVINPEIPVVEQIKSIKTDMKELWQNQDVPLHQINKITQIGYDILYTFQRGVDEEFYFDGEKCYLQLLPAGMSDDTLSVVINQLGDEYEFRFEYNEGYFTREYIQILLNSTLNVLRNIIENPTLPCKNISMISPEEKLQLLELSKGKEIHLDTSLTFVDMFNRIVKQNPDARAVVDEVSSITYGELDRLSDALAHRLVEMGVDRNQFVAVMQSRRKEFMISILGIFKAGAAYLPLDVDYPNDRLLYMLRDSQCRVLITTKEFFAEKQEQGDFNAETVIFADDFGSVDVDINKKCQLSAIMPSDIAYMIYTSGSTGNPKGVMIPHRALYAFVNAIVDEYSLTSQDKICCHSNFSFDASVEDIYPILSVGGELHIFGSDIRQSIPAMMQYIKSNNITGGCYTTKLGVEILSQCRDFSARYITLGGEKLDKAVPSKAVQYNSYGPTEFTVDASFFIVDGACHYNNIPIGRPIQNSYGLILDKWGNLMPRGLQGELCMSGQQIALGYWQRPEKTAEVFVANPYAIDDSTQKMYRTGDLVQWNDMGMLEYLGRIDNQVKLRGFRIELGEIETAISSFNGIASSIVEVREIGTEQHLCAYFTASCTIDTEELKRMLEKNLTEYMVPRIYTQLEEFPMTPNGKINRKLLPTPVIERLNEYVAPVSDLQKSLCQVFSEVLNAKEVGITDDFFDIGGTSLSVIMAIVRIENLGHTISYADFFRLKSVQAIADFIDKPSSHDEEWIDLSNYNYTAINELLSHNNRDLWNDYKEKDLGNILLTGPTGYLGIHVLRELLESERGTIYCLLRPSKDLKVENRMKTLLMYYFADTFNDYFGSRIKIIEGDITDPRSLSVMNDVRIDTVINCAALVKHYSAGNDIERVNVHGVENLIEFCRQHSARLIQTSTYSIGGRSLNGSLPKDITLREDMFYFGQTTNNKYIYSKFIAERLVLQAVADGLIEAKILRLGNLMARNADGEFQINFSSNAFVSLLRAYKVLKAYPLSRVTDVDELSPIDSVAEALVRLSRTPKEIVVLHPYNNNRITFGTITDALNDYGFKIDLTSDDEFQKCYETIIADPAKSNLLSGILHLKGFAQGGSISVPCDNDFTTKVLYRSNFRWPITGQQYIHNLIMGLDGMLFFDEN